MRNSVFRFKKFDCSHDRSSMKIGVDSVLLGAWADVEGRTILDVGTGCGVIALMCAQRNEHAIIHAIDIDVDSVTEASENFTRSPWSERLSARLSDFSELRGCAYDLIISNPPYFDAGVTNPGTPREKARHQNALSPAVLLSRGRSLLKTDGRIAMIVPADQVPELIGYATGNGLVLRRICHVQGHPDAPVKRVLLEFLLCPNSDNLQQADAADYPISDESLILEYSPGLPTEAHRLLCRDFYLKF